MDRIVLRPCRLRDGHAIPFGSPCAYDWPGLAALLAPTGDVRGLKVLRQIRVGGFLGLKPDRSNVFFMNENRSNDFGWLDRDKPGFLESMQQLHQVEEVAWDAKIEE